VAKQNRVKEERIIMKNFYVSSWTIGDGPQALTTNDET
jgi:hypothetical protein